MVKKKLSQNQKLFRRLRTGKHITNTEARSRYGIKRLAARVYDLRSAGFSVYTGKYIVRGGKNRGKSVTAYRLVPDSVPKCLRKDSYWFA